MARSAPKPDCERPEQERERCFVPPQRDVVQAFVDSGRAAWLDVAVSAETLAEALARLQQRDGRSAEDRLDHASDLYLACACATGDRRALAAFDAHFLTRVGAFVARINPSSEFAAEVRQQLRVRLLIADGRSTPRIGDYAGQGALGAWLRMAATRIARDLSRASAVQLDPQRVPDPSDGVPPDVRLLRKRYTGEYQAALREAWAALTVRERSVLRMCFVDGSTAEQVGVVFHVHRVTVARWISAARRRMMELTLQIVGERLRLPRAELQSIAQLIRSELDLRISQFAIAG
jgi:RNA polymerase sigma-70 factor (ECF subfamily)